MFIPAEWRILVGSMDADCAGSNGTLLELLLAESVNEKKKTINEKCQKEKSNLRPLLLNSSILSNEINSN